jgi:pSer/pThr/pTyr-binding forkhead associated (FHA) protein
MGRAALNDLVLDQPGVSRQHAGIRGDSEGYWIADLGSRNGTFVNGERLKSEPRLLRNFDRIELGGTNTPVSWVFMESQATIEMPLKMPE